MPRKFSHTPSVEELTAILKNLYLYKHLLPEYYTKEINKLETEFPKTVQMMISFSKY